MHGNGDGTGGAEGSGEKPERVEDASSTGSIILTHYRNRGLYTCSCIKSWTCYHETETCHPRFDHTGIVELVLLMLTMTVAKIHRIDGTR